MTKNAKQRIAIIGSGIGGLTAAWLLKDRYEVTVFEKYQHPGMGIFTVDYDSNGRKTRIDIPLRIFCEGYYPNLLSLYQAIGVRIHATNHSAAFADETGTLFFHYGKVDLLGRSLAFPKGRSLFSPQAWLIAKDSLQFFARAEADMADSACLAGMTLAEYLDGLSLGQDFVHRVLLPTLSVICTCDYDAVLQYPADLILGYLTCGVMQQGVIRAEKGVDDIVPRLLQGSALVAGDGVTAVAKAKQGMVVITESGERHVFDQVVMASQAQQSASVLQGFEPYKSLLQQVPYQHSSMLVHTDKTLLPDTLVPLSPVSYHIPEQTNRPEVTVDLTRAIDAYRGQQAVFQTWNPLREPRKGTFIAKADFTRPLVTLESRNAVAQLQTMQSSQNEGLWFCGAYMADKVPLLDAAVDSAILVAEQLGAEIPWRES